MAVKPRPSIAVLGFKNLANRSNEAWLSTALAEMFTTELAAGGQLRTIPAENVSRSKIELALGEGETFSKQAAAQFHANLRADYLVDGAFLILDQTGQLRLDLRVSKADQDAVVAVSETGTAADLFAIVSKAGSRVPEQLGFEETGPNDVERARAAFPKNAEAMRLYTEGLEKLRMFDATSALPILQQAVELDSEQPLIHSAIAAAWSRLGYDGEAADSAEKAFQLSNNLSREERLSIEGHYRESKKEWDKAADIYRTLWGFFSDDVEYGLRLATVQIAAGRGKDALATIGAMRQLPAPASGDPRIDFAEGEALGLLSDFTRQRQAYGEAEKKARSSGARLFLAATLLADGRAFFNLGQPEPAIKALLEAQSLFSASGDRAGVASALSTLAPVLDDQRDMKRSIEILQQSLDISREIGDKRGGATARLELGLVLLEQGELAASKKTIEEALSISRETKMRLGEAQSLYVLGEIALVAGDFSAARKYHEQALAIRNEMREDRTVVESRLALANLALEEGRPSEAEAIVREEKNNAIGSSTSSDAMRDLLLAEILLAQNKTDLAAQSMREAQTLAASTQRHAVRDLITITASRLETAQKRPNVALQNLSKLLVILNKSGSVFLQFEARLAQCEAELQSGDTPAALACAVTLRGDSDMRGFKRIAQKAYQLAH
jgi:tetratricopeptide (TPR) repeat protein